VSTDWGGHDKMQALSNTWIEKNVKYQNPNAK
jgi:hypothetical protein